MSTPAPWHQVVQLRDDVRSGDLALKMFAADLYRVAMRDPDLQLYVDPEPFFARTHATHNMRRLVGEIAQRLGGRSDKAIRRLALTYGGGKTHTLVTLLHLFGDPDALPDLPAVEEFRQAADGSFPAARVATLAFDKLDPQKGMEVESPTGERRTLLHPWSVLAYQLAGDDGLRTLHPDDEAEERETPPTEQWLAEVLRAPRGEDRATLILMDEVLVWARGKASLGEAWRKRIVDFFQFLTQAVTATDRTALVVSLLANDLKVRDVIGQRLEVEIGDVFERQKEEDIRPVEKRDVASVLRRQFFTPESINDPNRFRPHVNAAVAGIAIVDTATGRDVGAAEERYLQSYPFHPALTDIFYTKWTEIEQFQQTRGVLRLFASALRDAAGWDTAPLVGPNVFLSAPGNESLADAARSLADTARSASVAAGSETVPWDTILEKELEKAREAQEELGTLDHREVEQAVLAAFLHSQPPPHSAQLHELLPLVAHAAPLKIELEKGLARWARASWYLDDDFLEAWKRTDAALPAEWRLGSKPNLRQMHDHARTNLVKNDEVELELRNQIQSLKALTKGASALIGSSNVHTLPAHPRDVDDDAELHFAVLAPEAASEAGRPSTYARRFALQHTGEDKPRVYRNNAVFAVPSESLLTAAREAIRDALAWREVRAMKDFQNAPPLRVQQLSNRLRDAEGEVPHRIHDAYCLVVTMSDSGDVQAFKVAPSSEGLFTTIKSDDKARIQETAIEPAALLPGGPYDVWPVDRPAQSAKDLVEAFFRYPHLPKLLTPQVVRRTLVRGCTDGTFALRYARSDRSVRTYWLESPPAHVLDEPSLEAVLPADATIEELSPVLLEPGTLPGLWNGSAITLADLYSYFAGGNRTTITRTTPQGTTFDEQLTVPKVAADTIQQAVRAAVSQGRLWLVAGPASLWHEEVPEGVFTDSGNKKRKAGPDDIVLKAPPEALPLADLLPEALPSAWSDETTTARALFDAVQADRGESIPWKLVENAVSSALSTRHIELSDGTSEWPVPFAQADRAELRLPPKYEYGDVPPSSAQREVPPNIRVAEADLSIGEIQDLADVSGEIQAAAAGHGVRFSVRIELGNGSSLPDDVIKQVTSLLAQVSAELDLK